jgi:hypothetical protein
MWIKKWIHKNGSYGNCAGIQKTRDMKENGTIKEGHVMSTRKIHIRWLKFSPIECG